MGIQIGQKLGQYQILSLLGEGGMATVYRAQQDNVGRQVAIKVINADYAADPSFRSRFEREARTIAALSHPHILKLFDYGQQDDTAYLVMELMSGGSLNEVLEKGRLPLRQISKFLNQISGALDYAHAQGVVHRDLKPHNVLLDSTGNAFLTDFGLARILSGKSQMTQSGILIGTVGYMSPEQWRGEPATPASDIYSLGIMTFEMVAGKRPFDLDSTHGMMYAHLTTPPPMEILPDDVPLNMKRILDYALAKQARDRYQTAGALATDFQNVLDDKPLATQTLNRPSTSLSAMDIRLIEISSDANNAAPAPAPVPVANPAPTVPIRSSTGVILGIISAVSLTILAVTALIFLVMNLRPGVTTPTATPAVSVGNGNPGSPPPNPSRPPPTLPNVSDLNDANPPEPVGVGEQMIIVARLDTANAQQPLVTSQFVQNLRDNLESVSYSKIRIRELRHPFFNDEDAIRYARQYHAAVIVWGVSDSQRTNINIQLGDYSVYGSGKFPENTLRRLTDIRIQSGFDPNSPALKSYVLNVMKLGYMGGEDGYRMLVTQALGLRNPSKEPPALNASTPANNLAVADALANMGAYDKAMAAVDGMIQRETTNPLLYLYRSTYVRRLRHDDQSEKNAASDIESARRVGPDGWLGPDIAALTLEANANNLDQMIDLCTKLIKAKPDDWFFLSNRATAYLLVGKRDLAKQDIDRAISFKPASSYPYMLSIAILIREGNIKEAQQTGVEVLRTFSDTGFTQELSQAAYGDTIGVIGLFQSAAVANFIGQYDEAIRKIDQGLAVLPNMPYVNLLKGMAYCNLDKPAEAEAAYSAEIKLAPTDYILYAFRAAVRRSQGKIAEADADALEAAKEPRPEARLLFSQIVEGKFTCKMLNRPQK